MSIDRGAGLAYGVRIEEDDIERLINALDTGEGFDEGHEILDALDMVPTYGDLIVGREYGIVGTDIFFTWDGEPLTEEQEARMRKDLSDVGSLRIDWFAKLNLIAQTGEVKSDYSHKQDGSEIHTFPVSEEAVKLLREWASKQWQFHSTFVVG